MRVTGIGGGHGLALTLRAARSYADDVQAVVTVADDGGSSGRLTRELGIPPPGDIRNCLVALANDQRVADLFQHRYSTGPLTGHTVGNLIIAALAEKTGDFAAAVAQAGELVGAVGRVHPATTELIGLRARVRGGVVEGQVNVAQSEETIDAVYLNPDDPQADPAAVRAITEADQIVMGPGSLFTSVIATLLVPGICRALRESNALKVFVCNNRIQKGETLGFDAARHLDALMSHIAPTRLDAVVVQWPVLERDGVAVDEAALERFGCRVVKADISDETGAHDVDRLGRTLRGLNDAK